ncbi:c-type cytochrome, partial [candidate division KSB1 bacterium]|nr:c-type cytochrome [candidate division KSB1 bacterium]NIR73469.1 c-type cytochrome [candidate division KSB1 bacterium]NIS25273.1 c-type cytochrome [candidate division KSB1 bacterium]NIT72177.1 c-type cytochrome [candidate division KSB1 bacterium]NIU25995.1 c-type cytochrome [candidate division KSB1 bacterium]
MKKHTLAHSAACSATIFLVLMIGLGGCKRKQAPEELKAGVIPRELRPSETLAGSPELIAKGEEVYNQRCAPCHGVDGSGEGEAAYLLYPKPRDFVSARYRLVSTWERKPTDEDLYHVISRGIPGSAMPSWAHLDEKTRWALVHYVKSLAEKPFEVTTSERESGKGIIKVPSEPPYDEGAKARAEELFLQACASCHGPTGKGDGVKKQFDEKGYPTRPRDLTQGVFKGAPDAEEIYRRIIAGLPGSPMPMSDWAYGNDAWHLTHYVLSMSSEEQRERVEMKKYRILAERVDEIPEHPDAGVWQDAQDMNLHMMPLWWRDDRPEILNVKALHDGNELAIRLMWADESHDRTAIRIQDFRDAAAVQFALVDDPPFFGMGERGQFVNIWMWKSERQADLQPAFQDIDKVYPNIGIDSYPNLMRSALEQPTRNALTLESDPDFITGWGAGNIVSNPKRKSPSEDLSAQGFGTLRARPMTDQNVKAKGV